MGNVTNNRRAPAVTATLLKRYIAVMENGYT